MATIAAVHKIDRSLSTSHFVTNRQSVTSLQLSNHGPRGRRGRRAITSIRDRDYQEEAEEDMADDNWVFDSLVCFLHGPVWNAPLQTFIEEKSISELIPDSSRPQIKLTKSRPSVPLFSIRSERADGHVQPGIYQAAW